METESPAPSFMHVARRWSILLLVLGTLLISVSSVGFWVQSTVISEDGFVSLSQDVLSAQETREVISRAIVDNVLDQYPILRALVRDPLEKVITAILGSSLFEAVTEFTAAKMWNILFNDGGTVSIDISGLQNILQSVIAGIAPDAAAQIEAADLPDELVIVDVNQLPDLGPVANAIVWSTWLVVILGFALTVFMIARVWSQPILRYSMVAWTGIFLIAEIVILVLMTLPARSSIVLAVDGSAGRSIVGTTFDDLIEYLYSILLVLFLAAVAMVAVGLWKRRTLLMPPPVPESADTESAGPTTELESTPATT